MSSCVVDVAFSPGIPISHTILCVENIHGKQAVRSMRPGVSAAPPSQVPDQSYCTAIECQRERRRRWQQVKRQIDPDYRDNQIRAQQAWCERNPDYWREYRRRRLDYIQRNRMQQYERNAREKGDVAKMDVSDSSLPLPSGIYRMSQVMADGIAKMDVWTVEITVHTCRCEPSAKFATR